MDKMKIGVVGLGYVGLPLALELAKKFETIGFDISCDRVERLSKGIDANGDVEMEKFSAAKNIRFTSNPVELKEAKFIIVAVPTPVDNSNRPDLSILKSACETVGKNLTSGTVVVFESTVYPGATEEDCVPLLEFHSKLKWKKDFYVGYSPERINPGDKVHTIDKIIKVVSGDLSQTLEMVASVYASIIPAGVHKASSIKVAEAAKVIENTQRDLNIALINELSRIFDLMDISTYEVLEAAGTKWNFLPFKPGLVGGHCIGVDPYYLTHKATQLGYHPEVILAGRKINDGMGKYIANSIVKKLLNQKSGKSKFVVNVLGITFKEDVSDIRNSKVVDLIRELKEFGIEVHVADPLANPEEVMHEYGIRLVDPDELNQGDALVLAVSHSTLKTRISNGIHQYLLENGCFFDLKGLFSKDPVLSAGNYWTL